ncbi:MAG: hypothetical protein AAFU03_15055, partial [Bacteroidota bacterium]
MASTYMKKGLLLLILILGFAVTSFAQEAESGEEAVAAVTPGQGDPKLGKALWNENICGSCHNKNMKADATGPAL